MPHDTPRATGWSHIAGDLVVCLALLVAAGLLPPLHAGVGASLCALAAAAGLALLIPGRARAVHLLLLPFPLLCAAAPVPARPAVLWLALALLGTREESPRLRLASRSAALISLYALAFSLPQAWAAFDSLAAGQSRLLALLSGQALRLGPGALLHLPLFFLMRGAAQWAGGGGRRRLTLAALGLVLQTAGLALALRLGGESLAWLQAWLPLGSLLVFLALDVAAGAPAWAAKGWSPVATRAWLTLGGAGLLALAFLLSPPPARLEGLEIGFRQAGVWSAERPGPRDDSTPRLGGMIDLLRVWGARVTILDDRALEAGPPCRVLFLIQPDQVISPSLRAALGRWMEAGGVLVAAGEHTHVHGIGVGLGSLLQDYHIRLVDDCAIPSLHGWLWSHDLRFLQTAATAGLRDSQHLGVSIGASLGVRPPAWPVVTGGLAYSDAGDAKNPRGQMGNTRLDPGERLGDLPIVAAEPVGRGMLVVLGDKSPLMSLNNPLVWPFYLNLSGRLAARPPWAGSALLLGLLLASALGLAPVLRGLSAKGEAAAALLAVCALWWPLRAPDLPAPAAAARGELVWIDQSHQANWWHPPDHDWSRSGIVEACFAAGLAPAALPYLEADLLPGSRALLIAGSARPYSQGERRRLRAYVEQGGRLVVAGDGRRRAPLAGLLTEFGLGLGDAPLGAAPEGVDAAGQTLGFSFWEAWPVEDLAGGADTLASCWGFPLALRRSLGKGSVTVIGDERIFSRWSLSGPSRSGSWHSTATRFRQVAAPLPRPAPGEAKQRYVRRGQPVFQPWPGSRPPQTALAGSARLAPPLQQPRLTGPRPGLPAGESFLRARWALSLLGLPAPVTIPIPLAPLAPRAAAAPAAPLQPREGP